MDLRELQSRLAAVRLYAGEIDGEYGSKTRNAIEAFFLQQKVGSFKSWSQNRRVIAGQQLLCRIDGIEVGKIDGLMGEQTRYAFAVHDARKANAGKPVAAVEAWRDQPSAQVQAPSKILTPITSSKVNAPSTKPKWPSQSAAAMDAFFGAKGTDIVTVTMPFKFRIAWDLEKTQQKISCNKKVAENLERIWARVLDHYGYDELKRIGLDLFGGCLNVRKMRGGSAWSIHSWGCAWDTDPDRNQLKFKRAQATLDNPPYDPFWRFWYDEGAIGLGPERDYDWMHTQFAHL